MRECLAMMATGLRKDIHTSPLQLLLCGTALMLMGVAMVRWWRVVLGAFRREQAFWFSEARAERLYGPKDAPSSAARLVHIGFGICWFLGGLAFALVGISRL